jgi:hypothetical protein
VCLFLFLTQYMFRALCAHHQERQIVSIQPLVAVTLCRWPCRVQVRSSLLSCTRHVMAWTIISSTLLLQCFVLHTCSSYFSCFWLINIPTYLLIPCSRVLLKKLTDFKLIKFPSLKGTQMFITTFTSACQPVPILNQLDQVHTPTSHF